MHFIWNPLISKKSETGPGNINYFTGTASLWSKNHEIFLRKNSTECGKIPENIGRLSDVLRNTFWARKTRPRSAVKCFGARKVLGIFAKRTPIFWLTRSFHDCCLWKVIVWNSCIHINVRGCAEIYPNLKSPLNLKNLKHHKAKHEPKENDNSITTRNAQS